MNDAIIPEIIIYNFLKHFCDVLKESIEQNSNDSIIDEVYKGIEKIGRFDPISESKRIFEKKDSLNIKFGLNINSADFPSVHIILPDEHIEWETIGWDTEYIENEDNTNTELNSIHFTTDYNLLILDKNADTVVYIYHILKYMFLSYHTQLELAGFETLKISGRDLIQQSGILPLEVFSRNLTLSFKYTREFLSLKQLNRIGHSIKTSNKQIDIAIKEEELNIDEELNLQED